MKNRYRLYCRSNGMYYSYDCNTGKQKSLKTKNRDVADRLMAATNQASDTAQLNRALAKIYASGSSPELMTRTWSEVMDKATNHPALPPSFLPSLLGSRFPS